MSVRQHILRKKNLINQCFFNPKKACTHKYQCTQTATILEIDDETGDYAALEVQDCPQAQVLIAVGLKQRKMK